MTSFAWVQMMISLMFACHICLVYLERTEEVDYDDDDIARFVFGEPEDYIERRRLHRLSDWNRRATKRLANLNEYTKFRSDYLSHILRVRVPGTLGHHHVKNFLKNTLEKNGWTVELDEFTSETPVGTRKFTNVIGVLHPSADRQLALAAHYDSKDSSSMNLAEDEYFLGATDSAVPCAMLLDFAKLLGDRAKEKDKSDVKVSPMLVFLDGEEAFQNWSHNDSLYGSRHLAKVLADRPHHNKVLAAKDVSMLDALEAFVLFDLIGSKSPQPQFYDLYPSTSTLYSHLQDIENELKNSLIGNRYSYFPGKSAEDLEVEDDHRPFLLRGVPILHLISIPFPYVWHQVGDNESALDEDTIINLLHIFRQFLREYFDLHKS